MVVHDVQVRKTRKCLQEDEAVWSDGVGQALDVLEAQCQAVVSSKVAQLCKARSAVQCAEQMAGIMVSKVNQLQGELEKAEQRVTEL